MDYLHSCPVAAGLHNKQDRQLVTFTVKIVDGASFYHAKRIRLLVLVNFLQVILGFL